MREEKYIFTLLMLLLGAFSAKADMLLWIIGPQEIHTQSGGDKYVRFVAFANPDAVLAMGKSTSPSSKDVLGAVAVDPSNLGENNYPIDSSKVLQPIVLTVEYMANPVTGETTFQPALDGQGSFKSNGTVIGGVNHGQGTGGQAYYVNLEGTGITADNLSLYSFALDIGNSKTHDVNQFQHDYYLGLYAGDTIPSTSIAIGEGTTPGGYTQWATEPYHPVTGPRSRHRDCWR